LPRQIINVGQRLIMNNINGYLQSRIVLWVDWRQWSELG
jgi:hypothetical protein